MKIDLHMHSNASSDGQFTPQELASIAAEAGLDVIALADHDLLVNVEAMVEAGKEQGIEVIPALECSTLLGDAPVHLLGYGIDLNDPFLNSLAAAIKQKNQDTFHQRVLKMKQKYGVDVNEAEILEKAQGKNPWFTLIDTLLADPKIQKHPDFQDYLPGGNRGDIPAVNFFWDNCQPGSDLHVPEWAPDFFEMIEHVHQAGGAAIIAHPFRTFYQREDLLEKAVEKGIDGLEVWSNYHTPQQIEWYKQYAKDHNLPATCGSDFHGEKKPSITMGECHFDGDPKAVYEELKQAMAKYSCTQKPEN